MALDMFLEFVGAAQGASGPLKVAGESTDTRHPGLTPISAFTFSIQTTATSESAGGGAGAAKAAFNALTISKAVDTGSPALFAVSTSGAQLPQMNLYVRKRGGAPVDYLIYRFKTVLVTRIDWSASTEDDQPKEEVELVYGALELSYAAQAPNGHPQPPAVVSWNVATNKPE